MRLHWNTHRAARLFAYFGELTSFLVIFVSWSGKLSVGDTDDRRSR
jgi:hypothetical protein